MSVPTFGVTAAKIHDHYFPTLAAFSGSTEPTDTTVGEKIEEAAAVLCGLLLRAGGDPSMISTDAGASYPIAYAWCQRWIRLSSACSTYRAIAGAAARLPDEWTAAVDAMTVTLQSLGLKALGDAPVPAEPAEGARTHIKHWSLDTGDSLDVSDAIPPFRKSDKL